MSASGLWKVGSEIIDSLKEITSRYGGLRAVGLDKRTAHRWRTSPGTQARFSTLLAISRRLIALDDSAWRRWEIPPELRRRLEVELGLAPSDHCPEPASNAVARWRWSNFPVPFERPRFVGREHLIAQLQDHWQRPRTRVVVVHGFAGNGKTQAVGRWAHDLDDGQLERGFAWSFEGKASTDAFLYAALEHFGDDDPLRGDAWSKAERLTRLVTAGGNLLILDAVKQRTRSPTRAPAKDAIIQSILRQLLRGPSGFCVVTCRLPLAIDGGHDDPYVVASIPVDVFTDDETKSFLRQWTPTASDKTQTELLNEARRHPLTLAICADLLNRMGGETAKPGVFRAAIGDSLHDEKHRKLLGKLEKVLRGRPEWQLLQALVGLNQPIPGEAAHRSEGLAAILDEPVVPGLNDLLVGRPDMEPLLANLSLSGLLTEDRQLHAIPRAFFERKSRHSEAYKEIHRRLMDHKMKAALEVPSPFSEVKMLYEAIDHGIAADKAMEAFGIYILSVLRGESLYSLRALGLFELEMRTLSNFYKTPTALLDEFAGRPFESAVIHAAYAFCTRAQGNLRDALPMLHLSEQLFEEAGDHEKSAFILGQVAEIIWTLGKLDAARDAAQASIVRADQGASDNKWRVFNRTILGDVLLQQGDYRGAEDAFQDATRVYGKPLPGLLAARECTFLLSVGRTEEALARAIDAREGEHVDDHLVGRGRLELAIGHAYLRLAQNQHCSSMERRKLLQSAAQYIETGLRELRDSRFRETLPDCLLLAAKHAVEVANFDAAAASLAEATAVAEQCGAVLALLDICLFVAAVSKSTPAAVSSLRAATGLGHPLERAQELILAVRSSSQIRRAKELAAARECDFKQLGRSAYRAPNDPRRSVV